MSEPALGLTRTGRDRGGWRARMADCHPDRPHYAVGRCEACYVTARSARTRATCHPRRFAARDGRCRACVRAEAEPPEDPAEVRLVAVVGCACLRIPSPLARCPKCAGVVVDLQDPLARQSCLACGWDAYLHEAAAR